YIAGRIWHSSFKLLERRDGSVELRMKTSGWKELVRFVLSWQPEVKVLRPLNLRKRVQEKMTEALQRNP
ncbi:MAG: WYL domain-containing protein, partial [Kiritimatiellia bacterium]|nr:WYL domain-containing protein [Kiritimatiellia bacterium]